MRKIIYTFIATVVLCSAHANAASHHHTHSRFKSPQIIHTQVNLNTADLKQLSSLKGIGESKAKAIIAYRKQKGNFKSLNDLQGIKGIGIQYIHRLLKNNPGRIIK